ncbi:ABC transporter permease subunit [Pseudofrankia sp. DC12]|uniref:ABC transporter permease n=1 Tax=Pseudofrankia sp. DC12 TaxID=683315 RepID=UPI000698BB2D|nr:ABC transporter permease subunit [Pseudofrankia sp. DC12]
MSSSDAQARSGPESTKASTGAGAGDRPGTAASASDTGTAPAGSLEPPAGVGGGGPRPLGRLGQRVGQALPGAVRRDGIALLGTLPFFAYTVIFLGFPVLAVILDSFKTDNGTWTLGNIRTTSEGLYRSAFLTSIEVSLLTAAIGVVFGGLLAQAVLTTRRNTWLRRIVTTASGVFANFGGVPLAFAFIATLGTTGLATRWLKDVGISLSATGFSLYTFSGVCVVYSYFQVPLMVLAITPALEGLRPQWREAAQGLGASTWAFWRHVGLPVLFPSLAGAFLLLFGSSFAAYATAQALTAGTVNLVPIKIGNLVSGNVIAGSENVGKALGLEMILVIAIVMIGYTLLTRRASRWLR